jgi:hypothetical protein
LRTHSIATSLSSDLPLIVERAMYWAVGGHATVTILDAD